TGPETFTFTLREGASATDEGDTLETQVANSVNGGTLNFSYGLIPGQNYQMCELVLVGWTSSLSSLPGAFVIQTEPDGDNSTICVEFSVEPGETAIFNINNMPPPGGDARTIGYWRNWSSCTNGRQAPVLDYILWSFGQLEPPVVSNPLPFPWDDPANYPAEPYVPGVTLGLLQIDTCEVAVKVLRKQVVTATRRGNGGAAGNPAINMAAQLLAATLNVQAGAAPPCDPNLIGD